MSEAEIDDDSASSRKLTQEEVNALISGLDDQADPSTPAVVAKEAEVSDGVEIRSDNEQHLSQEGNRLGDGTKPPPT